MQLTAQGIPCNIPKVPARHSARTSAVVVHDRYCELTKQVKGLECTVIGPYGTDEHRHAIHQGFKLVDEWSHKARQLQNEQEAISDSDEGIKKSH